MTISLAFLAPDLVNAAIEGQLPHGQMPTDFLALKRNARRFARSFS